MDRLDLAAEPHRRERLLLLDVLAGRPEPFDVDADAFLDAAGRRTHRTTSIISDDFGFGIVLKNGDMSVSYNALGLPANVQYLRWPHQRSAAAAQ